ncbi:MAG: hypothetical protein PVF34_05810 [Gammaproteobacteria bacterium]|jgi:hypothetical protein
MRNSQPVRWWLVNPWKPVGVKGKLSRIHYNGDFAGKKVVS